MRTIIVAMLLFVTQAQAQVQQMSKTVLCGEPKVVLEAFQSKFKEVVRWTGRDLRNEENTYVLLANPKTRTFTLIEMNEKIACILGTGNESKHYYVSDGEKT